MSRKQPKAPPPAPPVDKEQAAEDAYVEKMVDVSIDNMLTQVLHPSNTVPADMISQAMALMITLAHDKKVTRDYFTGVLDDALMGISLVEALKSEVRTLRRLDLPLTDEHKAGIKARAEEITKQIAKAREGLHAKFLLIRQCKQDGVTLH